MSDDREKVDVGGEVEKVEDADFEGHRLEVGRMDDTIDVGRLDDDTIDVGRLDDDTVDVG